MIYMTSFLKQILSAKGGQGSWRRRRFRNITKAESSNEVNLIIFTVHVCTVSRGGGMYILNDSYI